MLPSSNISTSAVANEMGLGGAPFTVGALCSHPSVNMWSMYKPIRYNKSTGLTEQDYKDANYGFIISSQNRFSELRRAAEANEGWVYDKPTGGATSPYRLGDFRKYDHHATELFPLELSGTFEIGSTLYISTPTDLKGLTLWGEWQEFQGTSTQYLNAGFYVPGVGYFPLTDTDQGLTLDDIDSDKLNIDLTTAEFTVGRSYSIYLVLTTWDGLNGPRRWYWPDDSQGGTWWYLPSSTPASFTVRRQKTPLDYIQFNATGTASMEMVSGYYAWTNVKGTFNISTGSDYPYSSAGTLYVDAVIQNHYPGTGSSTITKTIFNFSVPNIGKNFSTTKNINGNNFNQLASKEDMVNLTVNLRFVVDGVTYTGVNYMEIYAS